MAPVKNIKTTFAPDPTLTSGQNGYVGGYGGGLPFSFQEALCPSSFRGQSPRLWPSLKWKGYGSFVIWRNPQRDRPPRPQPFPAGLVFAFVRHPFWSAGTKIVDNWSSNPLHFAVNIKRLLPPQICQKKKTINRPSKKKSFLRSLRNNQKQECYGHYETTKLAI